MTGIRPVAAIRWALAAALLGAAGPGPAAAPEPLRPPLCARPPLLDGNLDDPVWSDAARIDHLYRLHSDTPAPETTLYLARDPAWLYVGARCRNPRMPQVDQLVFEPDGPVQTDDSLELLLRPSSAAGAVHAHFALNFANVGKEQLCTEAGGRDPGWNPPWRTMTRRQADGWTAELAIPLFSLGKGDLSDLRINVARTLMDVERDAYGAKQREQPRISMLAPGNRGSPHQPSNFVALAGLGGSRPAVPFAPRIAAAALDGLVRKEGRTCYALTVKVEAATPVAGRALACVEEDDGHGPAEVMAVPVEVRGAADLELAVPAGDLRRRRVRVLLRDPADGNLLAQRLVPDTSALEAIRRAFAGRSYYTTEEAADLRVDLGLPPDTLARAVLTVEAGGRTVGTWTGPRTAMTLPVPLRDLAPGEQAVTVRLRADERDVAARTVTVVRLAPRPGREIKADFARGVLLKDGRPVVPVGIYASTLARPRGMVGSDPGDAALFHFLGQEIGLDLIVARDATNANPRAFLELAAEHGLDCAVGNARVPLPVGWTRGQPLPEASDAGLPDRLAHQRRWFETLRPRIAADTEYLREGRNVLAYYNGDEPNLINAEERLAVVEWYWRTVRPLDPYRPQFAVYSQQIPAGDRWTRWSDILAFDIYPRPYLGGLLSEPGLYTACYAHALRERCRRDHKIMWFVPLANMLDLGRTPIGLSRAHMLCQAYTALIYGARGLLYFALSNVVGADAWAALRDIGAQVRALTPALANGEVDQAVAYAPDEFRPAERRFPMVNAALFRYPDGAYALLAVNIRSGAVDARFTVAGLREGAPLFGADGGRRLAVAEGRFAETFEPYGVRAWRLTLAETTAPIAVGVEAAARPGEREPARDIQDTVRRLGAGANGVANPCFERQTNPGVPDFYRPFCWETLDPFWGQPRSGHYVDAAVPWNGHPSFRLLKRAPAADGFGTRGLYGSSYPPASDRPARMTFSVYARGDREGARLWVRVGEADAPCLETTFALTPEWARYRAILTLPARAGRHPDQLRVPLLLVPATADAPVWVSGLQLEPGDTPTDFRDDSGGGPAPAGRAP